ncbi:hypothetical protein P7K49_025909, partial [Saguinus oedipus]
MTMMGLWQLLSLREPPLSPQICPVSRILLEELWRPGLAAPAAPTPHPLHPGSS